MTPPWIEPRRARRREPRRPPTRRARAAHRTRGHYLVVGLAIGGLWLLNRDKSLLYHAVQMLAVMSVLTVLQIVLRRRAGEAPTSPRGYARLIGAKLGLVALAVGGQWLLTPVTSRSDAIVAAGLVVVVTALGPVLERRGTQQASPATRPDQAGLGAGIGSAAGPVTDRQNP